MKITYLSCRHANCGIGRYTAELANYMHKSEDVTLYRKGAGKESFIKAYPHRSLRSLKDYIAPYYLFNAIKNEKSQIWHADYPDAITALKWKGQQQDRVVTTAHDAIPFIFYKKKLSFNYYQYNMKQAEKYSDAFIVVSDSAKADLTRFTNIPEERIHTIYNGINHKKFYPDKAKKENEIFTIRYIGGLHVPHKNAIELIETARILEKRNISFKLEIGSGIGQHTKLAKLVKKYQLKNVHFSGFVPDKKLREYLAEADLFFYPSLYEGFGFPPLEAMACGTPVVAAACASLPEVLGNAAYLVKPASEHFADAIQELIANKPLRIDLRQQGIRQAAQYRWEKTANKTLKLYQSLA